MPQENRFGGSPQIKSGGLLVTGEKLSTLGNLSGTLLHWINNDGGAIRQRARELQRAEGVSQDESAVQKAQKIEQLANDLLERAGRLDAWKHKGRDPVRLLQMVQDALDRFEVPEAVETSIKVPADLPLVLAGRWPLTEVLAILVKNAIEAMPRGGILSFDGRYVGTSRQRTVTLRVSDTGDGVKDTDDIFKAGYSTKPGGLGFGLWWSRAYVEFLGGQLTVENRPEMGATFLIALPEFRPTEDLP